MFERFFGKEDSPERTEKSVLKAVEKEFSTGVDSASIYRAFQAAKEENESNESRLTNNHLLNIIKDAARGMSEPSMDYLLGGEDRTSENIEAEIEELRQRLSPDERAS